MVVEKDQETTKLSNTLKLEKKLLKDAEKYDSDVGDIAAVKREYLDKLREKRPFWINIDLDLMFRSINQSSECASMISPWIVELS